MSKGTIGKILVAACVIGAAGYFFVGRDAGSKPEANKPTAAAQKRTDMIFALNAEPSGLDPNNTWDTVSAVPQAAIYETLIAEKNGDSLTLEPCLAESWKISDDGKEVTFKIRKNVKFHNGDTMTVKDVAFSINRAIQSPYTKVVTSTMKEMQVVDDDHVKLIMKHPYLPVLNVFTSATLSIVSEKAVKDCVAQGKDFARNPCGTNAYQFVEWKSGEKIELKRFDNYWRALAPCEKFTFKIITDSTTGGIALEKGEIDILYAPARSDKMHLSSVPGLTWNSIAGAGFSFVAFNCLDEKSPFHDVRVRQAVAHAVKKEDVLIAAVNGLGTLIECPLSPMIAGYDKTFKFWEYDIEKAKKLLAEAGYPNGFSCKMKINQQAIYKKAAEALQAQMRVVGIDMQIELMERGAFLRDVMGKMDYVVTTSLSNASVQDPDFEVHRRYSSKVIGNSMNFTGLSDPHIDEILDAARYSLDQNVRNKYYRELFDWIKEQCPVVPMYTADMNIAFNSKIKNVYAHPVNKYFAYYYAWGE